MCIHYHGNVSTEPLPSNDKEVFTESLPRNDKGIHTQTHRLTGRIFNKGLDMGSGAMIYVPSFIKIGSGIQKLMGGYTDTHGQQRDPIILLYFFKIRKVG
jgi:hypothetical protein